MSRKPYHPIAQRNLILYAGLISIALAILQKPSLLVFFLSKLGILEIFLASFVSLFTALCLYEVANLFIRHNGLPWYVRPGGLVFLMIFIIGFFTVGLFFNHIVNPLLGFMPGSFDKASLFLFWGMTLLWVVFLERIRCK